MAPVLREDPSARRLRIRKVLRRPRCGPAIPAAQRGEERRGGKTLRAHVGARPVEPARRRVAVDEMERARIRTDGVRPAARARDDDVVAEEVERAERGRIERQSELRVPAQPARVLQEAGAHVHLRERVRHRLCVVERGEDGCLGPDLVQRLDDALGAAVLHEIVVHQRNPHPASLW